MTELTITRDGLERAAEAADLELEDFRTDYSGRGMYGARCIAVTADRPSPAVAFELAVQIAAEMFGPDPDDRDDPTVEEVREVLQWLARAERTDSLGRGTVTYWPGVTLAPDAE